MALPFLNLTFAGNQAADVARTIRYDGFTSSLTVRIPLTLFQVDEPEDLGKVVSYLAPWNHQITLEMDETEFSRFADEFIALFQPEESESMFRWKSELLATMYKAEEQGALTATLEVFFPED